MLIIGERINSSRGEIARAIERKDVNFIRDEAIRQAEAGAAYIDINAGTFIESEAENLSWLVQVTQEAVETPLCIDTPDVKAAGAALKLCKERPILNSITAESERLNSALPLLKEYKCSVIALLIDDSGMPNTVDGKLRIASSIVNRLLSEGIALDDIYIDPLVQPIGVTANAGVVVVDAIANIMREYPGIHTICAISNVSHSLPQRKLLNQVFAVLAIQRGLDAALADPCDGHLMANILACEALLGKDKSCLGYIKAYRHGKLEAT